MDLRGIKILEPQSNLQAPALWRKVLAAIFDFITAFAFAGVSVAKLTGGLTQDGFELSGLAALAAFALMAAYFIIGRKFLGGTLWQRVFKA